MNNNRRKELAAITARIEEAAQTLEAIREDLESLRDEEQEYKDNMPESIQYGEKGERADEVIGSLDSAISELEDLDFESITGSIEEASE